MNTRARKLARRATAAAAVVTLQAIAVVFFLADLAGDLISEGLGSHLAVESIAAAALLIGVVMGALQVRSLIAAARLDEAALALAKGAMGELVHLRFAQWRLTPAEADVALFALKGCDIAEISALRATATGTVRAQLARVYTKAGVTSHVALVAMFVDELLDMPAPLNDAVNRGSDI